MERKFNTKPLKNMASVGAVETRQARVWLRVEEAGEYKIRWWKDKGEKDSESQIVGIPSNNPRDNTWSVLIPSDFQTHSPLAPLTNYRFDIERLQDGSIIGQGAFETAPDSAENTPSRFAIAFMSCNQPFGDDGYISDDAQQMLAASLKCLKDHDVKMIFMVGDQMYSDYPENLSLFNQEYFSGIAPPGRENILECSAEEVRNIFQHRYRYFRNLTGWAEIHKEFPVYPIMDDHDIVDNWGSDPEHQDQKWQNFREGAFWAYMDYQGAYVLPVMDKLPRSFHYIVDYGYIAAFVMDLRSNRFAGENGQLYSKHQREEFKDFLKANQEKPVLFIIVSVPVVHLPRALARFASKVTQSGEDFSDRWSSGHQLSDRDLFLKIVYEHQINNPNQKIFLLSGDIHISCLHKISWFGDKPVIYQAILSAITHKESHFFTLGSKLLIRANREIAADDFAIKAKVRLLKGEKGANKNPYGGLNMGILEIKRETPEMEPKLRVLFYGHRNGNPILVYQSPQI